MAKIKSTIGLLFSGFAMLIILGTIACSDDVLSPEELVAGRYEATVFSRSDGAMSVDLLDADAVMGITLRPDLRVSGFMGVPSYSNNGTELYSDLAGTWRLTESNTLSLEPSVPSFLGHVSFEIVGDELRYQGDEFTIVLRRR